MWMDASLLRKRGKREIPARVIYDRVENNQNVTLEKLLVISAILVDYDSCVLKVHSGRRFKSRAQRKSCAFLTPLSNIQGQHLM